MNRQKHEIESMAQDLLSGKLTAAAFAEAICQPTTADLGDVTLDLDRRRRCGFPEVVYGEGKPAETLVKIVRHLLRDRMTVLVTRVDAAKAERLLVEYPARQLQRHREDLSPGPRSSGSQNSRSSGRDHGRNQRSSGGRRGA